MFRLIHFYADVPLGRDTEREWGLSVNGVHLASGCTSASSVEVILEWIPDWRDRLEEKVIDAENDFRGTLRNLLTNWWGEEGFEKQLAID